MMKPDRLLQHFEQVAEAPNAVPRLRRFILDLAVRGKLVEQDPKDEPAAELFKHILTEKERLTRNGTIRRSLPQSDMSEDDAPYMLPKGWMWSRLGDVIHLVSGQHLQPNEYSDHKQSGPPYITGPADFGEKGLVITRYATVRKAVATEDQILLTVKGAGVGKTAVCDLPEVAISRQLMAMTAIQWSQRFLLLTAHRLATALRERSRSLIPGISREDVEQFVFGLPPLAEQHRIVAKVDELMALCDELEAAQAKRERRRDRLVAATLHGLNNGDAGADPGAHPTFQDSARFYFNHLPCLTTRPEHIHQLRQTILNLAVRGKLSPQDLKDEPASALLDRIRSEKDRLASAGSWKKQKGVGLPSDSALNFEVPESWEWTTYRELAIDFRYGTSKKCSYERKGQPVLRIPNVSGGKITTEDLKFTNLTQSESEDLSLSVGDVLMVRSNGSLNLVGRPALVEEHVKGFCYAGYLVRVRFAPETVDSRYLIAVMNSRLVRDQIEIPIRTAVGLKNVNSTELGNLRIPLPPLAEQHRIVAKLDELTALCDELEARITTAAAARHQLLESTLHEALGGNS